MESYRDVDPEIRALGIRFVRQATETKKLDEKGQAHTVWEDRDFVTVVPDQGSELVVDLCDGSDTAAKWKNKLGPLYANWVKTQVNKPLGYPLEKFFANEPSKAKAYEAAEIWTVEQLASQGDANLQGLGLDAQADRRKAKEFVDQMKGARNLEPLVAKLAELESEKQQMMEQQKALLARLDALEKSNDGEAESPPSIVKRGPGRPKKNQEIAA